MIQEDKQLLLQDLCARFPYGVKVQIKATNCIDRINTLNLIDLNSFIKGHPRDEDWYDVVTSIKPYLRSLSSMTEEEKEELRVKNIIIGVSTSSTIETTIQGIDWLNSHHFDYRGLISKELALEAPEGMYNL